VYGLGILVYSPVWAEVLVRIAVAQTEVRRNLERFLSGINRNCDVGPGTSGTTKLCLKLRILTEPIGGAIGGDDPRIPAVYVQSSLCLHNFFGMAGVRHFTLFACNIYLTRIWPKRVLNNWARVKRNARLF
jgi:hypothetical protein